MYNQFNVFQNKYDFNYTNVNIIILQIICKYAVIDQVFVNLLTKFLCVYSNYLIHIIHKNQQEITQFNISNMRKILLEKLKFLLLIGLYIFCFNCDNFKVKAAVTKFTNLQCEALDPSRLTFKECRLKLIKRGVVALNIHANILKPVTYMLVRKKVRPEMY